MQITKTNKRKEAMLLAIGALGMGSAALMTADAATQTAEGFDLTKQANGGVFPVMFDRPSGINASALAGAVRTLGTNSALYKQAVSVVPELADANKMNSLLNDALSNDSVKSAEARGIILKLINWYNSLGGFQIKTQSGAEYTASNLDEPINTIAVGFANSASNKAVSDKIQQEFGVVKTTGDVMNALEKYKVGVSNDFKNTFNTYASKVYAQGADISALSQINEVAPLLNSYEMMYANGATAIRDTLIKQNGVNEASVAFFESAVITGRLDNSSNGTTEQNNVPGQKVTTKWVDINGKELSPSETGENYKGEKSFDGYVLRESKTENGVRTYVYDKVSEKTRWVDVNGKELKPETTGTFPDKEGDDVPGYRLVKTETKQDGGNTVTVNTYEKVEEAKPEPKKPDTYWFDDNGNSLKEVAKGQTLPDNDGVSDIPGYTLLRAYTVTEDSLKGDLKGTKFQVGDVINIYQKDKTPEKPADKPTTPTVKVTTTWVDESGKEIKPKEDGAKPDVEGDDVPGYKHLHTVTDKDGNVTNVYTKVVKTHWVDKDGKPLKDPVDGEHPDKEGDDLPGYKLVETKKDKDGNIINIYEKIQTPSTTWVDESGKELKPKEDGAKPDAEGDDIPGYTLVRTTTDPKTGDVTNIYKKVEKKVVTHWVDESGKRLAEDETGEDFKDQKSFDGYQLKEVRMSKDGTEKFYIYEKKAEQKSLPKTGDEANGLAGLAGAILLGLGGLGLSRKKRDA